MHSVPYLFSLPFLSRCRGIDSMRDDIGKIPVQYMSGGTPVSAIKALDHITPSAPDQVNIKYY